MSARRALAAAALAAAGAAALAGCGSGNGLSSDTPRQIAKATVLAMSQAYSTTVHGTIVRGGARLGFEVSMFQGGAAYGTFGPPGARGDLVIANKKVFVKGSSTFWEGVSALTSPGLPMLDADKLAGRWVELGRKEEKQFSSFTYPSLLASVERSRTEISKVVGTRTIDEKAVVGISSPGGGTLWVETSGSPLPVAFVDSSGGTREALFFSDWGQGSAPTVPVGAESLARILSTRA